MYTVNQGPSKLVAKTRTGLSQNYDKIESICKIKVSSSQSNKSNSNSASQNAGSNGNKEMDINVAKPVFQQYRRTNSNRNNSLYKNGIRIACFKEDEPQPPVSPQYEELIRYIRNSWNVLSAESESSSEQQPHSTTFTDPTNFDGSPDSIENSLQPVFNIDKKNIVYHNDPPSPALQDFGPFDLESWWGRRLFNNITKSL